METWELTPEQLASLSGQNQQKYVRAAQLKDFKEAQYWSEGNKILKRMGWTEREWFEGNQAFSRLHPPADLSHLETTKLPVVLMETVLTYNPKEGTLTIQPKAEQEMQWEIVCREPLFFLYEYPPHGGERYLVSSHRKLLEAFLAARNLT